MRTISYVNLSTVVKDADVHAYVVAQQKQINSHFVQAWGIWATLKFVPKGTETGEVIYIQDNSDQPGALGYHELSQKDSPVGYVFAKTCIDDGVSWQSCASHETLEQLVDPWCTATWVGTFQGKPAAVAAEVCDPVENDTYTIDGVPMSNFILPLWGVDPADTPTPAAKFDFLHHLKAPFTMDKGGYVAYTNDLKNFKQAVDQNKKTDSDAHYYRPSKDRRTPNEHVRKVKAAYFAVKVTRWTTSTIWR